MRNCIQADDRSLALSLRVETLTQEFEELQRLRGRVRKAEAKRDLRMAISAADEGSAEASCLAIIGA
jgi:hypothetical protein